MCKINKALTFHGIVPCGKHGEDDRVPCGGYFLHIPGLIYRKLKHFTKCLDHSDKIMCELNYFLSIFPRNDGVQFRRPQILEHLSVLTMTSKSSLRENLNLNT